MVNIVISIALLIVAGACQIYFFLNTQSIRRIFKNIFPEKPQDALSTYLVEDSNIAQIQENENFKVSSECTDIISSINNHINKNNGATEFAVLKDIVDRNCDAVEEQIETTSPFPIYIGLCGTLIGIVFGVAILGFSEGIDSLLSASSDENIVDQGATGIKDLLRGVAVAMSTTFLGVILTIYGSATSKNAAKENSRRKNLFLNWMQEKLLPQMNDGMVKTLNILQRNLTKFNKEFAENSKNLNEVFSHINTTYEGQAEVLRLVEHLQIDEIATANIRVLQELQQCTGKISILQEFINQSSQHLTQVEELNRNLTEHHDRTLLIENMGKFFMDEVQQIELRKAKISKSVGEIDKFMQTALKELSEHTHNQYIDLTQATAKEHNEFLKAIDEQQQVLSTKLAETSQIIEELKNLTDVKESMMQLVSQGAKQEEQMSELLSIKELLSGLASTGNKQNNLLERLGKTIMNMPIQQGYTDSIIPTKKRPWLSISITAIAVITCLTLIGTCIFYIYNYC